MILIGVIIGFILVQSAFLLGEHLGHKRGAREAAKHEEIRKTAGPVIRALAEKESCD